MTGCCDPSPLLTAAELAAMAALVSATFTGSASIARPTRTVDALGGQSEVWATVASAVPCNLSPTNGTEQIESARDVGRTGATLEVPAGTDVRAVDRVTVAGRVFEVLSVEPRTVEVVRVCRVVEVV